MGDFKTWMSGGYMYVKYLKLGTLPKQVFVDPQDECGFMKYVPVRICRVVRRDRDEYGEFAEYSCGHANVWQSWSEPSYCCWCGARVVE